MRPKKPVFTALALGVAAACTLFAGAAPVEAQSPTPTLQKFHIPADRLPHPIKPDLIPLAPVILNAMPSPPGGFRIEWKLKNQGAAATQNRVRLVISCQVVPAGSPPGQICYTLNNDFYLGGTPAVPPPTPSPLLAGQVSEPIVTVATAAAAPCTGPHARITATVDPNNQIDEGAYGESNNTRVWEICANTVIQK